MKKNGLAYLALLAVCLIWGTTFYALKIGVETFPPLLFSAIRQTIAGLILISIQYFRGQMQIEKSSLIQHGILGILLIALGNGWVGWSERYIPSGLAALIGAAVPICIVLISYLSRVEKKKPNRFIGLGLAAGTVGIFLIFSDNFNDLGDSSYFWGMMLAFASCLAWAGGTVYMKKIVLKGNIISHAGLHMLFGGIFLFFMSFFLDDYAELKTFDISSMWALLYLIVFGSVLTYPCYVYALEKLPVGLVSLYAYINPLIALLLGYFFLQERFTPYTGWAVVFVLLAVFFINKGTFTNKKSA